MRRKILPEYTGVVGLAVSQRCGAMAPAWGFDKDLIWCTGIAARDSFSGHTHADACMHMYEKDVQPAPPSVHVPTSLTRVQPSAPIL